MNETRRARLEAVIQEELSVVIPREVKDPRVPSITITSVKVTPDGSQATVFISILGDIIDHGPAEKTEQEMQQAAETKKQRMKDCLEGLASAAGYLRRHMARILSVRHVPTLLFKEDRGLENVLRVNELLKKISEPGST
jgi:ribosome-binding factor A